MTTEMNAVWFQTITSWQYRVEGSSEQADGTEIHAAIVLAGSDLGSDLENDGLKKELCDFLHWNHPVSSDGSWDSSDVILTDADPEHKARFWLYSVIWLEPLRDYAVRLKMSPKWALPDEPRR